MGAAHHVEGQRLLIPADEFVLGEEDEANLRAVEDAAALVRAVHARLLAEQKHLRRPSLSVSAARTDHDVVESASVA